MKNIKNILLAAGIITLTFVSCDEDGYDDYGMDGRPTQEMNGEWFIDIIDEASGDVLVTHAFHKTYDDNNGRMYIDDRIEINDPPEPDDFAGWWLVTKVDVNTDNLTFSATDAENQADGSIVNITEGKILKRAAHSPTGSVVDSIYFKGEFDYEPGRILIFKGYKRTGFIEEE